MERRGVYYKWQRENVKYSFPEDYTHRASDATDSDLEEKEDRSAYLSERVKNRAIIDELSNTDIGIRLLIAQRELAMYEAKRRPGFDQEVFDEGYPVYKFKKRRHKKLRVKVS